MELRDRVYQLGGGYVSCYAVEEGGKLTIIDAGLPGQWDDLMTLLSEHRWHLSDVEAIVVTHAHPDHIGIAERVRQQAESSVYVHEADVAMALGETKTPTPRLPLWRPRLLRTLITGIRLGMFKIPPILEVSQFSDGETLDLPGSPRVIHTPGHTAGSCAIHMEKYATLFAGDALATIDVVTGNLGPRIPPKAVNADSDQALASLDNLEGIEADLLVVGHGPPWSEGAAEAVRLARDVGIT